MGQVNFKKPFEIQTFNERFQCGMTRLRITNLGVFLYNVNIQELT